MQIEITTLGAGTYDVECKADNLEELAADLAKGTKNGGVFIFSTPTGKILINHQNIVSIRRKR